MIATIEQFIEFVSNNNPEDLTKQYNITARQHSLYNNLWIFSYTHEAMFGDFKEYVEIVSRGLIIDVSEKKVVARPFDKFFNFGERGRKMTGYIDVIVDKLDGSLGIAFFYDNQWHVSTRGTFDSVQGIWATNWLRKHIKEHDCKLNENYTYLFEIIYPENQIILNYGSERKLVLLAVRETQTGNYLKRFPQLEIVSQENKFELPKVFNFGSVEDILAFCGDKNNINLEGFVATTSTGELWKFKGDWYLSQQRLKNNVTPERVLKELQTGNDPIFMIGEFDDEVMRESLTRVYHNARKLFEELEQQCLETCEKAKLLTANRKDFVMMVGSRHKIFDAIMKCYDGKDYTNLIWRSITLKDVEQ